MRAARTQSPKDLFPDRKHATGAPLCAFCGAHLPKGLRRWCSSQCQEAAYDLTYQDRAALKAFRRDEGRCVLCGLRLVELKEALAEIRCKLPAPWFNQAWRDLRESMHERGFDNVNRVWHVHHIVPVAEGGTLALSNLQTLCVRCHKRAHQGKRLAQPVTEKLFK